MNVVFLVELLEIFWSSKLVFIFHEIFKCTEVVNDTFLIDIILLT